MKIFITNRGLSLEKLQAETGILKPDLSRMQNGKMLPNPQQLEEICKALHVTPADIYPNDDLRKIIYKQ